MLVRMRCFSEWCKRCLVAPAVLPFCAFFSDVLGDMLSFPSVVAAGRFPGDPPLRDLLSLAAAHALMSWVSVVTGDFGHPDPPRAVASIVDV